MGDKVSEGSADLRRWKRRAEPPPERAPTAASAAKHERSGAPASGAAAQSGRGFAKPTSNARCLVLGAGPGGYTAAFRAADLGMKVVLVERYADARRRLPQRRLHSRPRRCCMSPRSSTRRKRMARHGVAFGEPKIDIDKLRGYKDKRRRQADRRPRRHGQAAQGRRGRRAWARSSRPAPAGSRRWRTARKKIVRFDNAIIAAGSRAGEAARSCPDDPRIVDSTGALELRRRAQAPAGHRRRHHRPGDGDRLLTRSAPRVDVVEMMDQTDAGRRPRPRQGPLEKRNAPRFDKIMLKTKTVASRSQARTASTSASKASRRRATDSSTTWCWSPSAARPNGKHDRRRQGRRRRDRARLHPRRQADAHQRAAHLRHRRHRRPADAGAQGRA